MNSELSTLRQAFAPTGALRASINFGNPILAAKGDVEGAKAAFEMAIRTNPSYAIAHENLGDVLMQLARQSYLQALSLDPKLASASRKLEQLQPALKLLQGQP